MADNFFGATDTGRQRDNNEDAFLTQTVSGGWILACVIDGVGGYEGGEIAAAIARETLLKEFQLPFTEAIAALKKAVVQAAQAIYSEKQKQGSKNNMACVLTVALADIAGNQFYYAHVGDTRMYLLRDGSLVKVTKDHSFVGFLEDSGRISEKEAMEHPKRNEINKALGFDLNIGVEDYIETGSSPFLPGDSLLLCSDGLTDMVNKKDITTILLSGSSLKQKVEALIGAANNAGGKDNITAVMVANNKKPAKQKATRPASVIKKNEASEAIETILSEQQTEENLPAKKRHGFSFTMPLILLCLLLAASTYWFWKQAKELTKPTLPVAQRVPNAAEKRVADSIAVAQKTFRISDSVFKKNIIIGDTVFIRQDSLHLVGNGITLQADSSYNGPLFFVTANCRYLLLENMRIKNFATAIILQGKGLQLKNIIFQDVALPVQQQLQLPVTDTITGILKDTFLMKKDSTRK